MDFYVYQLNYASKDGLEQALVDRGVLVEVEGELVNSPDTLSVVHLGFPVLTPAVYDEEGNEVSPAVVSDKYHCDIKVLKPLDFPSANAPNIKTPFHGAKWRAGAVNL